MFAEAFKAIGEAIDTFFNVVPKAIVDFFRAMYKSDAFQKMPYWFLIAFAVFNLVFVTWDIIYIINTGLIWFPFLAALQLFIASPYVVGLIRKMRQGNVISSLISKLKGKKDV
jgi:hypothetical protein